MSTCQLSAKGTTTGVVDSSFKVEGVSNLRIVDASVFVSLRNHRLRFKSSIIDLYSQIKQPSVSSGHPMGAIYAVGELAADLIKSAHGYAI